MKASSIRAWSWVHLWSSLVCTLFLIMLCLTGLPLIFHDEIDGALNPDTWQPANPNGSQMDLDSILDIALQQRDDEVPIFLSFDLDRPVVNVTTGPTADAAGQDMYFASFDLTSGEVVPPADVGEGIMHLILQLHTDLFLGLPGMFFLAAMGFLFLIAIVSGVVLYAPFMKKLNFGTIRTEKSTRTQWLDYHNLMGIVCVAWVMVVGLTGIINALEKPIIDVWRANDLNDLITQYESNPSTLKQTDLKTRASLDEAVQRAVQAAPNMNLQFVAFPGSGFSTDHHYAIFLHGRTPLTEHLITPVLIDAQTGQFEGLRHMPWYSKALSLSRPLHFGDYGGLTLKVIWALLNVLTLVILISGLYLWWTRRKSKSSSPRITTPVNHDY